MDRPADERPDPEAPRAGSATPARPVPPSAPETDAQRWALLVEYDGAAFHGWQRQPHAPSVQQALETALSRVADATDAAPIETVCAGRTDAGVHATAQVVHFDTLAQRVPRAFVWGTNAHLPPSVRVVAAQPVTSAFHARFSARARRYRYVLRNAPEASALAVGRCAHWRSPLDDDAMRAALPAVLGTHDFSSFRAAGCQARSPVRTLHDARIVRQGDVLWFDFVANAFLHHMVRNLVGSLLQIGEGEVPPDWLAEVLAARDRRRAGITAPAEGLYFVGVDYPADVLLGGPAVPASDAGLLLTAQVAGRRALSEPVGRAADSGGAFSVLRLPWWMTGPGQAFDVSGVA